MLYLGGTGVFNPQPAPTAISATATLTVAQLLNAIITASGTTAKTLTLPTGMLVDAAVATPSLPVNSCFDWAVINTGTSSGAVTVAAGTGHTLVGSATVAIGTSAGFRTRKTAANTFVTYRVR